MSICYGFTCATISAAGLPVLIHEEVELKTTSDVLVVSDSSNPSIQNMNINNVVVTNFRLLIVVKSAYGKLEGHYCLLEDIRNIENCNSYFHKSSRMKIWIGESANFKASNIIVLKFLSGSSSREGFQEVFQRAIDKKSWLTSVVNRTVFNITQGTGVSPKQLVSPSIDKSNSALSKTANAGVSGILRKQEKERQEVHHITKDALSDLESLMTRGKEVVNIVNRYASYIAADENKSNILTGVESTNANSENADMEQMMQSIGLISPVTRMSAGRMYHQQLARQIADVLLKNDHLKKLGGMITLIDLYCLYNKARGTELVSPDDLYAACKLCGDLSLPLRMKEFRESGVKVMELCDLDYKLLIDKIAVIVNANYHNGSKHRAGTLASNIAISLNMSILITVEVLLLAEQHGVICRDDNIHGLEYYPNMFNEYIALM